MIKRQYCEQQHTWNVIYLTFKFSVLYGYCENSIETLSLVYVLIAIVFKAVFTFKYSIPWKLNSTRNSTRKKIPPASNFPHNWSSNITRFVELHQIWQHCWQSLIFLGQCVGNYFGRNFSMDKMVAWVTFTLSIN